jgi:hypothetical protein
MCLGGGDGGSEEIRKAEEQRAARVREGAERIKSIFAGGNGQRGFDQSFYDTRKQAYLDFANPQLERQYGNAQRELTFALARSGILDSSAAARKNADAAREYGLRRQEVADKAQGFADQTKNDVEKTKADLLSLNANLADPDQAVNVALARAKTLESSPQFDSIGTLFQNATAGIATLADAERRRNAYSGAANYYGNFGTSSGGSGRMVS